MPNATLRVDMNLGEPILDAEEVELLDAKGEELYDNGYIDITDDVRASVPVSYKRGTFDTSIFGRVADIGTCTFMLDNSAGNSAGIEGYYSPDNANNVRNSFGLDTLVRLTLIEDDLTEHPEWQGRISTITPEPGLYGNRGVMVTAEDWMGHAARARIKGITVQQDKTVDEIIPVILALSSVQPGATSLSAGDDTFAFSLHDENSTTSSIMRIFQKLAMSEFGKIYLKDYETLTYLNRGDLILATTPAATLSDTMNGLTVTRSKDSRVYEINIATHPVEVDTTNVVLWKGNKEIEIAASTTIEIWVELRDPNGRSVRVASNYLLDAVAGTDYKFSSVSESQSGDKNGDLSVGYDLFADTVKVTLENTSVGTGYLSPFQIRGKGIYLYDAQIITASTGQPDGDTLNIDMVYQDDIYVGDDILTILTSWFITDQSDVKSVSFIANKSDALLAAAFLYPNQVVTIAETLTGINSNFFIQGIRKDITNGGKIVNVTWDLSPAKQVAAVCILDLVGYAELDSTAILGI